MKIKNLFGVAPREERIEIILGHRLREPIPKEEALNLAAWLVRLSGATWTQFDELLEEVEKT